MLKLKGLMENEKRKLQERKNLFFSPGFSPSSPSREFPSSWQSIALINDEVAEARKDKEDRDWILRPDYLAQAQVLCKAIASATPVFDKKTEEGVAFRIYRLGSIDIR